MNLKNFASPVCSENNFIKISLGGFAGSGKTRTGSELAVGIYKDLGLKKPMLIIDNEKGSRFLVPFFKNFGIETYVKDTLYIADIIQAFSLLEKGEIDFLFIDSLTKIWYQYIRDYREKNYRKFMTLQDWGKILPAWQEEFSDRFVNLNGCVIFTGRGGYQYDMEENDETHKKEFIKSGVKMKLAGETPFEPDLNIWMQLEQEIVNGKLTQWREAQVLKDRSNIIDGEVFKNPTYDNFKPVIEYIKGIDKGTISKETDTTNLAPSEEYTTKKIDKKILLEKIYGELENAYPGTGKEERIKKSAVKKSVFGTFSDTEIENLYSDALEAGLNTIVDIVNSPTGYQEMIDREKAKKAAIK